jgi:hypothetical protein
MGEDDAYGRSIGFVTMMGLCELDEIKLLACASKSHFKPQDVVSAREFRTPATSAGAPSLLQLLPSTRKASILHATQVTSPKGQHSLQATVNPKQPAIH